MKSGPFNLGDPDDYRVPDRGIRPRSNAAWFATAALVVEIVAPDDETRAKVAFYAAHDVGEIVIADPMNRSLEWMAREDEMYRRVDYSTLLGVDVAEIEAAIDWPPTDD